MKYIHFLLFVTILFTQCSKDDTEEKTSVSRVKKNALVGAYYFDGWSGTNSKTTDPNEPWALNAPSHLTRRTVEEFSDREPIWGWRDDDITIMEKQIDLAADNGIDFFAYCWYWRDPKTSIDPNKIDVDPLHTSLHLHPKAKNKQRLKYALLVANHVGAEIVGKKNWGDAVVYWSKYFKDPQYVMIDEKPLVVLFSSSGATKEDIDHMQAVAIQQGFKGLSIAGCYASNSDTKLDYKTDYNVKPPKSSDSKDQEHSFSELVQAGHNSWKGTEQLPHIPTVTIGWDKRPGEEYNAPVKSWHYTRSPQEVTAFISDAIEWMDDNPTQTTKERLMLIYAWNEIVEGGYLVPTKGDPNGKYLEAVKMGVTEEVDSH